MCVWSTEAIGLSVTSLVSKQLSYLALRAKRSNFVPRNDGSSAAMTVQLLVCVKQKCLFL